MEGLVYSGLYNNLFSFITNKDLLQLQTWQQIREFIFFVEDIMTNNFLLENYENTPPSGSGLL
jgi:hypothetical protein